MCASTARRLAVQSTVDVGPKGILDLRRHTDSTPVVLTVSRFGRPSGIGAASISGSPQDGQAPAAPETDAAPIFAAVQEQLGLKLEPKKGSIDLFVIDHVEKTPTEN